MEKKLEPGIKGESKTIVSEKNTSIAYGSGSVEVLATPAMIGLMENAALTLVQPFLPEGQTTVGAKVTASHIAPTPLGMEVVATAELIEVEGKKLVFKVEAHDQKDKIGEGTHVRFIINTEKFMDKLNSKGN